MEKEHIIKVLEKQIEKLNAKEFDLTAWKNSAVLLLEKIFGKGNPKIRAIENIKYDQGSWVLRDQTGYTNSMEACKKLGKEIMEEAIMELEAFGPPETGRDRVSIDIIITALEDELTGSQFRELKSILSGDKPAKDKKKLLMTKLKSYDPESGFAIVANILTNKDVSKGIS
jgi:hypothetical protein